jgi:hypothetical protein
VDVKLEQCGHMIYAYPNSSAMIDVVCDKPATHWYLEWDEMEESILGRCDEHKLPEEVVGMDYREISYEDAIVWEVHKS